MGPQDFHSEEHCGALEPPDVKRQSYTIVNFDLGRTQEASVTDRLGESISMAAAGRPSATSDGFRHSIRSDAIRALV